MFDKFRAHLTSAHIMAAIALFIALGATAYAVERNSVGTKQLKNKAVKTAKIANGAVTTAKLKNNAVSGAKLEESSLGQVPSAASAANAANATNATNAVNAVNAENATTLAGREFLQVRSLAVGNSDGTSQGLDSSSPEQVMTDLISIPTGGADLMINASVELNNNTGGQLGGQCEIRTDGTTISQVYNVTLAGGFSPVISLTAFADNLPGTGALDPENIGVFCTGSGVDDNVSFSNGDLSVLRIPSGA